MNEELLYYLDFLVDFSACFSLIAACTTAPLGLLKFIPFSITFYILIIPYITAVYSKCFLDINKTKI